MTVYSTLVKFNSGAISKNSLRSEVNENASLTFTNSRSSEIFYLLRSPSGKEVFL